MDTTLVVLAAGMGSRYGGLKQLEPLGPGGETLRTASTRKSVGSIMARPSPSPGRRLFRSVALRGDYAPADDAGKRLA